MRIPASPAVALIMAAAISGCGPAEPPDRDRAGTGSTAFAHTSGHTPPPAVPSEEHPSGLDADGRDPAAAAAHHVVAALDAEGLQVEVLATSVLAREPGQATVRVEVAHSLGHGHPTQAAYRLTLERQDGGWRTITFTGES
jgi:hypothetical protein